MKYLNTYKKLNLNDDDAVFSYLLANIKPSNTLWGYFVNWKKVFREAGAIEIELNLLNYLIGKEDFDNEFRELARKHPEVIRAVPALLVRDGKNKKKFDILIDFADGKLLYQQFDFTKNSYSDEEINDFLEFMDKTGLKYLLQNRKIKNLVDYIIGVEAGLDSNGRKNRGGTAMEQISEAYIKRICERHAYEYLAQANAQAIKAKFNMDVPVDKSSRIYDFAINTPNGLTVVEVNYYGGGGSKLKSTAGEYRDLQNILRDKFKFVWITDGAGWPPTARPLRETFNHNDYVINLDLLENGALEEILQ
jgi:type II restriction enzyme